MKKDKRECNNMLLRIEENLDPAIVEEKNNEYANEVELTMEMRKGEEQHQQTKIENVLVGIDKFNFPINLVILGNEEDKQVVSTGRHSNALSRAWIDIENGEMTLLVGKEKVKFNLHQSIHLIIPLVVPLPIHLISLLQFIPPLFVYFLQFFLPFNISLLDCLIHKEIPSSNFCLKVLVPLFQLNSRLNVSFQHSLFHFSQYL